MMLHHVTLTHEQRLLLVGLLHDVLGEMEDYGSDYETLVCDTLLAVTNSEQAAEA